MKDNTAQWKPVIIQWSQKSDAVLVLESSEKGMLKVGRKGVGTFCVKALGKASHAGLDPEAGMVILKGCLPARQCHNGRE